MVRIPPPRLAPTLLFMVPTMNATTVLEHASASVPIVVCAIDAKLEGQLEAAVAIPIPASYAPPACIMATTTATTTTKMHGQRHKGFGHVAGQRITFG